MPVIARLRSNGNLSIAGNLYTTWPAFDDQAQVDNARQLDDTRVFDENGELDTLLGYMFEILVQQQVVSKCAIDHHGNLLVPVIYTNTGGISLFRIATDLSIMIRGSLTEGGVV